jgi:hypothetical protein
VRKEDVHIILKSSETRKWREILLSSKLLNANEDATYRRIIKCTNVADLIQENTCIKLDVNGKTKLLNT